jgi:hypothetical protein
MPGSLAREIRYFQEQLSNARAQLDTAKDQADIDHWRAMIRRYEVVLDLYDTGRLTPSVQSSGARSSG